MRRARARPARRAACDTSRRRTSDRAMPEQRRPSWNEGRVSTSGADSRTSRELPGSACQAEMLRTPRKRPPPAAISASSTSRTAAPSPRSAYPTIPAATAGRTELTARAHRGDPIRELHLPDRLHRRLSVLAIHRLALHEHGRDDVVAGARYRREAREEDTDRRPGTTGDDAHRRSGDPAR